MHSVHKRLLNLLVGHGYRKTANKQLELGIHLENHGMTPECYDHLNYAVHLERVARLIEWGLLESRPPDEF